MIERFSERKLLWVNLKNPTTAEVQEIMHELSIPPSFVTDLTLPVTHCDAFCEDGVVKFILKFPIVKRTDINHPHELTFIVSKDYFVTVHYEDMEALDRFKKEFEVLSTLGKTAKKLTNMHLAVALLEELYKVSDSKLDYLESQIGELESTIFKDNEKELVFKIAILSKKLVTFRQTIKAHDDVFRNLRPHFERVFKEAGAKEIQEVYGHYFVILRRAIGLLETIADLRETNFGLLTTKQNEIMKTLTIMAFITFPLTLFTSTFGMNTVSAPILGIPGDFWIIIGIMTLFTFSFFSFFRYKRWI